MKVRMTESSVELCPENGFERDAMHQLKHYGVAGLAFVGEPRCGVLEVRLNVDGASIGFNDAAHLNGGGQSPCGFPPKT